MYIKIKARFFDYFYLAMLQPRLIFSDFFLILVFLFSRTLKSWTQLQKQYQCLVPPMSFMIPVMIPCSVIADILKRKLFFALKDFKRPVIIHQLLFCLVCSKSRYQQCLGLITRGSILHLLNSHNILQVDSRKSPRVI